MKSSALDYETLLACGGSGSLHEPLDPTRGRCRPEKEGKTGVGDVCLTLDGQVLAFNNTFVLCLIKTT